MRKETIVQVFLVSPSDVAEERLRLTQVVDELNTMLSQQIGVRLEIVKWETHTYPAIGSDAQAIINTQIGDEYDVLFCIIGSRLGSPTPRAESGTVEEYQRSLKRWKHDPTALQIMVYFKDAPLKISEISVADVGAVQKFRRTVENDGVLYKTFTDLDGFGNVARIHLAHVMHQWSGHHEPSKFSRIGVPSEVETNLGVRNDDGVEEGFLDLEEIFLQNFETMTFDIGEYGRLTKSLSEKMNKHIDNLHALTVEGSIQDRKAAKKIVESAASDMMQYAAEIGPHVSQYTVSQQAAFEALSKYLSMAPDTVVVEKPKLTDLASTLVKLRANMYEAVNSSIGFRNSTGGLPRLTSSMNKAKRQMTETINTLVVEMQHGVTFVDDVLSALDQLRERLGVE